MTTPQFVQRLALSGALATAAAVPFMFFGSDSQALGTGQAGDECPNLIVNGSFESPVLAGGFETLDSGAVEGWETTASDSLIELWPDGLNGVAAPDGTQFAELNANEPSTLFQDLTTPDTTELTWTFDHRGTQETDTVAVVAGPPDGPLETIFEATTSPTEWATYTGTYQAPEGQPITRFGLKAVTPEGSIGNLVDNLSVTPPCDVPNEDLVALPETYTSNEIGVISADASENDTYPEGEAVEYQLSIPPAAGSAQMLPDGRFDYFGPRAGATESFDYQMCLTGTQTCATATINVSAVAFNEGPWPGDDQEWDLAGDGSTLTIDVLENDDDDIEDGIDPSTLRIVIQPQVGSATVNNGVIEIVSPIVTGGTDAIVEFDYEICDIDGACATATVFAQFAPPNRG